MLDPIEFQKKYKTTYTQQHEESFLTEASEEDLELWTPAEILTGRDCKGNFNKFNILGKENLGRKYKTVAIEYNSLLKKFVASKTDEEKQEFFNSIWERAKTSNKCLEIFINRVMGKQTDKLDIKIDDISFAIDPKKIISNYKKDENGEKDD